MALKNISNWIADKSLYYSPEHRKYLYGFYAGLGNFDLFELPSEYQCLISNSNLKDGDLHAVVLSILPIEHTTTDEIKPYETHIRCVVSAKLYGYQHTPTLLSAIRFAFLHHAHIVQIAGNSYRLRGKKTAGIAPVTNKQNEV
jgi:hypothetical protein|tara:strand:+ start:413 stop:841 length:429 start_codon:yes stop_codon:yes gene_type:complete